MVEEDKSPRGGVDACPICLEPITGEAFLDQCFHRFCFHCILQWSEMLIAKPQSTSNRLQCLKCPLCKSHYTSIIHDLSGAKFQRHYILTSQGARYESLDSHRQRQAVYGSEVEQKLSRFANVVPKPNRWLSIWVQRELQAIMQEEDVDTVKQHVVGVVEAFNRRVGGRARVSAKGGNITQDLDWHTTIATAVQPFIFEHAEKFAEELGSFLLSGLDIVAYDRQNQLRASVADRLALRGEDLKELPGKNTFNFYDEDVDDDGVDVMVGRSTEAECPKGGTSEDVEHNIRDADAQAQRTRYSRRGTKVEKDKQEHVNPGGHDNEGADSTNRHSREARKKRKRGRSSPSPNDGQS